MKPKNSSEIIQKRWASQAQHQPTESADNALMRSRASQSWSDQHGGCLSEASFRHARPDREAQGTRRASMGCPFVWFVYFGQAK
jgi:hypothetical protein